jgi:diacylglycerol kinase (ATP)
MKIKAIINSNAKKGSDKQLTNIIRNEFASHDFDIEFTKYPKHATEIARIASASNVDLIIAVGGDGTVNEIINGIIGSKTALGIIPTGTANDLATLNHIPTDIIAACRIIKHRNTKEIDIINVNGWNYITGGGIGLPTEVARISEVIKSNKIYVNLLKQTLGSKVYILAMILALIKLNNFLNDVEIYNNEKVIRIKTLFMMINNQSFIGKIYHLCPKARNDDGFVDICLLKYSPNIWKMLCVLFKTLSGTHIKSPLVQSWKVKKITIKTKAELPYLGDGEIGRSSSNFNISVKPRALKLITPVNG